MRQPGSHSRRRRATDYTTAQHIIDQLLARISGNGWMARIAQRLGQQRPPQVISHEIVITTANPHRPPLRLVFAADFHASPTTHPDVLTATCALLAALQPDVLALGGDYVSLHAKDIDPLAALLGSIPVRYGRFGVLGNHDLWVDETTVVRRLVAEGVQLLVNQRVRLPAPYDDVWLCGLDDPGGSPDAAAALGEAEGTRVVLMHSPQGLQALEGQRFDLALCGHTHGGQIGWPDGRAIWLPPGAYNRTYPHGRFTPRGTGGPTLLVSRGVGYGGLPIRLFAPADVLLCTLRWRAAR